MHNPRTVALAISFAEIAKRDARVSWLLYKHKQYAPAVYHLQQAVEKDAKAIGLLRLRLNANEADMRKVGHMSIRGLLLNLPQLLELREALEPSIKQIMSKPEVKAIGFDKLLQAMIERMPSTDKDTVKKAIEIVEGAHRSGPNFGG